VWFKQGDKILNLKNAIRIDLILTSVEYIILIKYENYTEKLCHQDKNSCLIEFSKICDLCRKMNGEK
jgi:hypothetical protein